MAECLASVQTFPIGEWDEWFGTIFTGTECPPGTRAVKILECLAICFVDITWLVAMAREGGRRAGAKKSFDGAVTPFGPDPATWTTHAFA